METAQPELRRMTHAEYTGFTSDELNEIHHIDGWPCTHEPPHGIALKAEGVFVVTRHFPDERPVIMVSPWWEPEYGAKPARAYIPGRDDQPENQ